jgi:hypothetical protein
MHNYCSGLFTCIINYLYIVCIILMILNYVLYITLMMFIYVYYELFTCINLVYVISLFFMIFSFHLPNFDKNRPISDKNHPELATPFFRKNRPIYRSNRPIYRENGCISVFFIFTVRLRCVSINFSRFSDFLKNRRNIEEVFLFQPNFRTLLPVRAWPAAPG